MKTITGKTEFVNLTATLCARMVSTDSETRIQAARDAAAMLDGLPMLLKNSPHCKDEIAAVTALVLRVEP